MLTNEATCLDGQQHRYGAKILNNEEQCRRCGHVRRVYCRKCGASLSYADREAGKCTQCNQPLHEAGGE